MKYLILLLQFILIVEISSKQVKFVIDPNVNIIKKHPKIRNFLKDTYPLIEEGTYEKETHSMYISIDEYGNTFQLTKNYFQKSFPKMRLGFVSITDLFREFNEVDNFKLGGDEFDARYNYEKFGKSIKNKIDESKFSLIMKRNIYEVYDFNENGFKIDIEVQNSKMYLNLKDKNYISLIKSVSSIFIPIDSKNAEKFKKSDSIYLFCKFNLDSYKAETQESEYTLSSTFYQYHYIDSIECGLIYIKTKNLILEESENN